MCGIVGLYLKNSALEGQLGQLFEPMLIAMTGRGPDSAGFAIYGDEVGDDMIKLTLQHEDEHYPWHLLAEKLEEDYDTPVSVMHNANAAVLKMEAEETPVRGTIGEFDPSIRIMSVGHSIEILKEVGLPENIAERFSLSGMKGSHIIGHTRMATESGVTMEGSHPFSTGMDLCLVHNGSLSNHNRLREELERKGIQFETENDSEVAAGYLTWRLREGASVQEALEGAIEDLDGFFTFTVGTKDGFAVVRDPIACKPAVMAETEDYVAMASEYHALSTLPGIENAKLWEPDPGKVYFWGKG
ncbi:glutamine amidotransferase family protein [Hydrogenovibrio sp. JE_KL2]|uniref:class II glutamine amidotransferase n=1 Tax=Hydrogenovibrio sp. JE_KL2 TaxID=2651188 RepID=UPI00128DEA23|nr:glutamine amidotransferase family protein [Hydrogenovibrio sp. JE_KL2]MBN2606784.1 glutamine amidotransferase family protein [Thiotrichales bacterium]MPQ77462.1 amidophosphoribosyltransferase [Hydrogenovibrio sp. JE_KL2]